MTSTLYQHVDAPPVPPRQLGIELPSAFEAYLLGLLAKRPEGRPTAQEVADWFGTGAWRGGPEPLPQPELPTAPRVASSRAPADSATAHMPSPVASPRTTGRRAANRQRRGVSEFIRYRPRVASLIAGAAAFLAALFIGMLLFSPDASQASNEPDPSASVSDPSASPSSSAATASSAEPEHEDEGEEEKEDADEPGERDQEKPRDKKDRED